PGAILDQVLAGMYLRNVRGGAGRPWLRPRDVDSNLCRTRGPTTSELAVSANRHRCPGACRTVPALASVAPAACGRAAGSRAPEPAPDGYRDHAGGSDHL